MARSEAFKTPQPAVDATSRRRTLSMAYPWPRIVLGLVCVAGIALLAAGLGSVSVPPSAVMSIVLDHVPWLPADWTGSEAWDAIIWRLRLPRVVLAGLVGAALAASGATYQGLFRNPLADPYLIGVAAGAGLGATIVLVSGVPAHYAGMNLLPFAAFGGATLAVAIAYVVARRTGRMSLSTLILAGVAVASISGALTSLIMIRANPDVRPVLGWLLGGFASARWSHAAVVLPYLAVGTIGMLLYARVLNVLQLGEDEAEQLGVSVERTKIVLVVLATMTAAAAVAVSGVIGFVGLIAPHAVRLVWGRDHRTLIPMALLAGAAFLILADLVARTVASPSELPVGIVTAFCGGPFFLYLLVRMNRRTI